MANKEVKVRPRTWISYRQLCRDHIVPVLGGIRLNKLGSDDVERLYASMLKEGSSPKTVRNAGGVLHSVLETAVKYRYLRANVAAVVELPRHSRPTINTLDERQVRTLVEAGDPALVGRKRLDVPRDKGRGAERRHDRAHLLAPPLRAPPGVGASTASGSSRANARRASSWCTRATTFRRLE